MTTDLDLRLARVFEVIFNRSDIVLRDDVTARDVAGWDSFNHINLIIQTEQEFGVTFSDAEVSSLRNVGQLKRLIAGKLQDPSA
jgi:acyl carrier protein